ncbi:MAG: 23S rRNA (uracil(1939)-C(5))-methyltransferase RlmD, partial [Lachnospiraceae bacterium]|nr:23S rRNA (uracil(1939)-C(5))-methyltransferase RlmD [Lachnospiraceae bacterium]
MKKGEIYEGKVCYVNFPNKAIIEHEDGKVTVKNALPGQTVKYRVTKKRKGKAEGNVLEVLEKSEDEIASACPHFEECGGCTYQNLPYEKQLELKSSQVKKLLDEVYIKQDKRPEYTFEGIKGSPKQFAYRNKMEFSFGDEVKDGPLSLGMHKRGSFYDIVTVSDCQIVDEDFRLILQTTLAYCKEKEIPFYHRMRGEGFLRHLLVRKAVKTGEIMVALITTSQDCALGADAEALLAGFVSELCKLGQEGKLTGKLVGILHTENDSVADVVKNDGTKVLYGQDYFYEELLGLRFKITEFSFFQTNSLGAEVLYDTARSYIGDLSQGGAPDKVVFDLYSGTGTIAQLMAPVSKKVIGVEIVEEAVEAAKKNAELNGLHNCEFIVGDVLKVLDTIEEKPDFIILDPPRDGIHPKALKKIIDYGVDRLVYISCKPTSLARDLEVFEASGYRMEKACCVDMFPGTVHVETVVLLGRKKVHDYIYVDYEPKDTDYLKDCKHKATY